MPTFGQIISEKRKAKDMTQKELATKIIKEDGQPISPQYLNDLEHDRRNAPSEYLMKKFAEVLEIQDELLYFSAGELTPDIKQTNADATKILEAYQAFRKELRK